MEWGLGDIFAGIPLERKLGTSVPHSDLKAAPLALWMGHLSEAKVYTASDVPNVGETLIASLIEDNL